MTSANISAGAGLDVSFTLRLPADASMDDIQKWLRFELGTVSTFDVRNALNAHEMHGATRDVRVARTGASTATLESET